jgi:hypothetical protein
VQTLHRQGNQPESVEIHSYCILTIE